MYGYERRFDRRSIAWIIAAVLVVVAVPMLAWFAGKEMYPDEETNTRIVPVAVDDDSPTDTDAATSGAAADSTPRTDATDQPAYDLITELIAAEEEGDRLASTSPTTAPSASSEPATTEAASTSTATSTRPPTTTIAASTTTRPTTTTTEARRPKSSSTARTRTTKAVTYSTLPDGSPQPVIATFDVDTITLSGTVPSQAAADRLGALALANSKTPASLVNFLGINPNVPKSVGVRVIELTSARFPENSAVILPDHALEFDRVATVMEALPNVTALVIGHADQRGSPEDNFAISDARARATVSYLVGQGIDPDRLSSRAVGESDLLMLNNDETAFALNRRTEFVFYGLIADT